MFSGLQRINRLNSPQPVDENKNMQYYIYNKMALLNGSTSLNNFKNTFFAKRNNPILHNRYVWYVLLFLAVMDVFYFSTDNDPFSIVIMFIIGFLISIFNKNMIVILFFSVVLANIIKYGSDVIPPRN